MLLRALGLGLLACLPAATAQAGEVNEAYLDALDFIPTVVPLAVRSPYLGTYLMGSEDKNLANRSPQYWTEAKLGWQGLLRVDGEIWNWMGNLSDWPAAINSSLTYTSSESTFIMTNDPPTVALTATFLSPITPHDLFRQSLPFSYLEISVESLDGQDHTVEAYTEINGQWLSDNEDEELEWETKSADSFSGMNLRLKDQRLFQEEYGDWDSASSWTDHALYGDVWYAARTTSDSVQTAFAAGDDSIATREQWILTGHLYNSFNSTMRPIRSRNFDNTSEIIDEPCFAISHAFGTVSPSTPLADRTALVTIGHLRDPITQYKKPDGEMVSVRPLWSTTFETHTELIEFFLDDYENVRQLSQDWNQQLYSDARRLHSQDYAHVLAISTRQIFGALEAAVDYNLDNSTSLTTVSPFTSNPIPTLVMLKEVSSNGNCQTIDVIAPFLPFLIYASPKLLPLLLEPLYRYSASGLWKPLSPPHDLGNHYPNFTGHDDYTGGTLQVEESGNMLGMALAGMRVGEEAAKEQAGKYYGLLKQWADYLVENALFPDVQSSTDDFFGPSANQTSLVVKGIMGIRAMSEIAADLNNTADRDYYSDVSKMMVNDFLKIAISLDDTHLVGTYGNDSSYHGQYNLYFDKLFNTSVFPASLYDREDSFWPTVNKEFGPALDSRFPNRSKTDWLGWLAACAAKGSKARDIYVNGLVAYVRQTKNWVFGDYITPEGGWSVGFLTRPVVGGHFSLLALDTMDKVRSTKPPPKSILPSFDSSSQYPYLLALLGLVLVAVVGYRIYVRRRDAKGSYAELGQVSPMSPMSPFRPGKFRDEE